MNMPRPAGCRHEWNPEVWGVFVRVRAGVRDGVGVNEGLLVGDVLGLSYWSPGPESVRRWGRTGEAAGTEVQ